MSRILGLVLLAVVVLLSAPSTARGQWVITDPSTTARNAITAALKARLVDLLGLERDRLDEMARRLSALTTLDVFALSDPPRWRTHGGDFLYGQPYNDALIFGDPTGAAYTALSRVLLDATDALAGLDPRARRAVLAQLATLEAAAATAIAGTHQTGQLRLNGRRHELLAIDALEAHVIDPDDDQSLTAVLDKVSGAVLIGARQRQARVQLLAAVAEQLLLENKRTRDAEAAAMNMLIGRLHDGRTAGRAPVHGAASDLRGWRQP